MSDEYKECLKNVTIAPRALAGLLSVEEQATSVILPVFYVFLQKKRYDRNI